MAQGASRAWRRDCADLFLIAATPAGAQAAAADARGTNILVGVCPPGKTGKVLWMAGDIENKTFAFEATSEAYKELGGIDMTWNFAKISLETLRTRRLPLRPPPKPTRNWAVLT